MRKGLWVVEGSDIGSTLWICADTNCKDHHSMHANHERTPAEEKRLQKERERQQAKQEKF